MDQTLINNLFIKIFLLIVMFCVQNFVTFLQVNELRNTLSCYITTILNILCTSEMYPKLADLRIIIHSQKYN